MKAKSLTYYSIEVRQFVCEFVVCRIVVTEPLQLGSQSLLFVWVSRKLAKPPLISWLWFGLHVDGKATL